MSDQNFYSCTVVLTVAIAGIFYTWLQSHTYCNSLNFLLVVVILVSILASSAVIMHTYLTTCKIN